jgi:hypothetical protein
MTAITSPGPALATRANWSRSRTTAAYSSCLASYQRAVLR